MTPLSASPSNAARAGLKQLPSFSALGLALADALLVGIVLALVAGFGLERMPPLKTLVEIHGIALFAYVLARAHLWTPALGCGKLIQRLLAGNVVAWVLYSMLRGEISGGVSRTTFAEILLVATALQGLLRIHRRTGTWLPTERGPEVLRWILLIAVLLLLHHPLLTHGSVGAGDAYWYSIMVADFTTQWRAGIFPVFVGQSEFAFNGAVSPLRLAPYLQHLAGVIDTITFHQQPFYGLLNLSLVASFVGGALSCYFCLRAIEPRTPWLALLLSLLYSACPGVLALAYAGDLFMSITCLPYVPLVLYGAWRTVSRGDFAGVLAMVAGAAALWYCHPPIALWATAIAAISQCVRLFRDGRQARTWRQWGGGALIFVVLTGFCFVSVLTLHLPTAPTNRAVLVDNVRSAYPAALHPVSTTLIALSDYQLGWSLWAVLAAGVIGLGFSRPRLPAFALLAGVLLLLAFILPTPWLLRTLWFAVPQAVCDITYMWPMQRFYVLLAALTVFIAFGTLAPLALRHRFWRVFLLLFCVGGAAWSAREAGKFHRHAHLTTSAPAQARQEQLPQNHVLTRYSFNPFPDLPSYFSHGFIDPRLENRLLASGSLQPLASNQVSIANGSVVAKIAAAGAWRVSQPDPNAPSLQLQPTLHLEPGRQYVLRLDFAHPEFAGGLVLRGTRLNRLYWLPDSGFGSHPATASTAFGALPGQRRTLLLWTDQAKAEDVTLQFFFNDNSVGKVTDFGRYELAEFDPARLPISVKSWTPYVARTTTAQPAFLETPRLYLDGYRAEVNGRQVPVSRSPDALVMIPVPAGDSEVRLSYPGPVGLRLAYFTSLGGWLVLLALALVSPWRRAIFARLPFAVD